MTLSPDPDAAKQSLANLKQGDNPAPKRNGDTVKSGAWSEIQLAPLRERWMTYALERWPHLDEVRLHLVADLGARVDRVRIFKDEQDILVEVPAERSGRGKLRVVDVHPAVSHSDKWESRLWQLVDQLDAEPAERQRDADTPSLADVIAEIEANREVTP